MCILSDFHVYTFVNSDLPRCMCSGLMCILSCVSCVYFCVFHVYTFVFLGRRIIKGFYVCFLLSDFMCILSVFMCIRSVCYVYTFVPLCVYIWRFMCMFWASPWGHTPGGYFGEVWGGLAARAELREYIPQALLLRGFHV